MNKKLLSIFIFPSFIFILFFLLTAPPASAQLCNHGGQLLPNIPEQECKNLHGTMVDICHSAMGAPLLQYKNKTTCESLGHGIWTPAPLQASIKEENNQSNNKSGYFGNSNSSIGEYIKSIYKYAIGVVGIIATIVIMIGGLIWITSMGNAQRVSSAKDWIGGALTGLALAMFSYTLLWIINPDLVNFKPVNPDKVIVKPNNTPTINAVGCNIKCKAGEICRDLPTGGYKCVKAPNTLFKPRNPKDCLQFRPGTFERALCDEHSNTPYSINNCPSGLRNMGKCKACQNCTTLKVPTKDGSYVNSKMANALENVYNNSTNKNWRVTEAWPPTVPHESTCHQNGSCVDINFNNKSTNPREVNELYNDLANAGLKVTYEHPSSCAAYSGVNCMVNKGVTPHFHVSQ